MILISERQETHFNVWDIRILAQHPEQSFPQTFWDHRGSADLCSADLKVTLKHLGDNVDDEVIFRIGAKFHTGVAMACWCH